MGRRKGNFPLNNKYSEVRGVSFGETKVSALVLYNFFISTVLMTVLVIDYFSFRLAAPTSSYGMHLTFLGPILLIVFTFMRRFSSVV